MVDIVTVSKLIVSWRDEDIRRISGPVDDPNERYTSVFGAGKSAILTRESPEELISRLSESAQKGLGQLTRLDGKPTWIAAAKVTEVREPRPRETSNSSAKTMIDSGGVRTAVKESVEETMAVLKDRGLEPRIGRVGTA